MFVVELIQSFVGLLFPNLCEACGTALHSHERVLCVSCIYHLPRTHYWEEAGNPVEQLFWGKLYIEHACALFFFEKGSRFRKMLHKLKYNGKKEIGFELGRRLGMELKEAQLYQSIDVIVPVPLHPKKQHKRGYNQSEQIALGIAKVTGWAVDANGMARSMFTASQTNKTRLDRWENVAEVFSVNHAETLAGKHILLVDDVITTGATLEACIHTVQHSEDTKISIATLALSSTS